MPSGKEWEWATGYHKETGSATVQGRYGAGTASERLFYVYVPSSYGPSYCGDYRSYGAWLLSRRKWRWTARVLFV